MKKEKTIRTYQRRTKTGKVVTVKQHTAKYDAAEAMKEAAKKKGAGDELEALKKKKPVAQKEEVKSPYEEYGFTKDDFKEWYEGTGSKADKKVEKALKKAMGTKAYNALSDKAADEYKKGGAHRFFTKGLEEMKASTSADMKSVNSGKAPQGDQTVSASMLRGTKKEKVTLTGKSVKDSSSDSLLRIGKRKDGSYDIFESSDNGKSWSYAEGWKDAGDYKGTAESSLARKNGFKIVKDGGIAKLVSKVSNIYGGMTKEEFEKHQRDFAKRVKDADKGTRAKYSFTDIRRKIKEADISDAARKRLLKSIDKPYAVVTPAVMEKRLQKELDKSSSKEDKPKKPKAPSKKLVTSKGKTPKGSKTSDTSSKVKEAHAALKEKGYKRYTYKGEVYYATKSGSLKQVGSDGRVRNVVPFKGAKGTQEGALIGWKRRDAEKAKAKRDKEDAKKYRESLKSKGSK